MGKDRYGSRPATVRLTALMACLAYTGPTMAQTVEVSPATMPRVARVDQRYQSYNVEMAEVIGGTFGSPTTTRARLLRTHGKRRLTALHGVAPVCSSAKTRPCSRCGPPST